MRDLDDTALERRLREVLDEHLGALALDLTVDDLHRRRKAKGVDRGIGRGRGMTLLAAAAAVMLVGGALVAGSGVLRPPAVVPPVTAPSFQVALASPAATTLPAPSPTASLTPLSLDLTWTQIPLDEGVLPADTDTLSLAWLGDRFFLADAASGTVRTSTDGESWQAMPAGDAAQGYVSLMRGSAATWQRDAVGVWNPQDGPDYANKPPITTRDIVTVAHASGTPVSTTPFKGRIESIGIGPKGIVAEVHSHLDPNANPTNDRGYGWYSPDGVSWTRMTPNSHPTGASGSTLPTGEWGPVVGVSDGFIAVGARQRPCANLDDCTGMWFSSDGLSWRFLGTEIPNTGLLPWMGGALVPDDLRLDFWSSDGFSKLPMVANLPASMAQAFGTVATGPLGLVKIAGGQVLVSRDGSTYQIESIPPAMAEATRGINGGTTVAVGDRSVVVLRWATVDDFTRTPSLWLGTFAP
jgi:hypothetical protein